MARTGLQAINDAIADSKSGGGFSGRLGYFALKDGETIALRFLTDIDDVLTVDFYEFVFPSDGSGKGSTFVVRPDLLEDPSAEDYVRTYGGVQKEFGGSELLDLTPKTRTVAIAVVQKEVVTEGKNGRPSISYEDEWDTVETKAGKFEARKFITVKMAYKNFWAPLVSHYDENGTLCDRIFKIKRTGAKTDTSYSFMEKQVDPDWEYVPEGEISPSYKALHKYYGYGTGCNADGEPLTEESEDRFAYCPQTLEEWAEDQCSEERVKYFLGGGINEKKDLKGDDSDEAQATSAPKSGGSLQSRLARHR